MVLVGERIKVLRKNKGFTQKELSEKLGVTEQAISKWERDKSYPSMDVLQAMFHILDCSPNDLFNFNESEKSFSSINSLRFTDKIEAGITPDIILLEIGENLVELFTNESLKGFESIKELRVNMAEVYGIIVPMVRIRDIASLPHDSYRISIGSKVVAQNTIYSSMEWGYELSPIEGDIEAIDPIYGFDIVWTKRKLEKLISPAQTIASHLEHLILKHFDRIISLQYVSDVIDVITKKNPVIKEHIVPARVSYQFLKKVLARLVVEKGCRLNELVYIVEATDDMKESTMDVNEIVDRISERLEKMDLSNRFLLRE